MAVDPVVTSATPEQLAAATALTVTSGADISAKTLKAINLARYTAAQISDNGTPDDASDDYLAGVDASTNADLAGAVDKALKASGAVTTDDKGAVTTAGYDPADPMAWAVQNLLDSNASPWAGRLRDFLTALAKDADVTAAADGQAAVALAKDADDTHTMTADVTPAGVWLILDRTAKGASASIPMLTGTGVGAVARLGTGDKAQTLGAVEYKPNDTTPEKKIVENGKETDSNTASIGDTVTYRLKTDVPNWTGYDHFRLRLGDTMTKGLTFKAITKVAVGKTDPLGADYYKASPVSQPAQDGSTTFTVEFGKGNDGARDILADDATKALFPVGAKVTVEYTAVLNKDAAVNDNAGNKSNDNTVTLEYSHNPNDWTDAGRTPGNTVRTYTGRFQLNKTDASGKPLAGAKFTVTAQGADKPLNLIAVSTAAEGDAQAANVYRTATADDDAKAIVTEITTPASGKVFIQGLKAGAYTIRETHSPLGATALPTFTLTIDPAKAGTKAGDPVRNAITAFTADPNKLASTDNVETATVKNVRNILELPKTGAVWLIAYAAGAVLAALGAALTLRRRA
ncbi:isopeptide-forming domain-containing fimbrial protein [Bifidobacterium myosotis]|uniref:Isopeptide-forming domain-containing fimbrial protein n=1 Tax=Bifidobacterium myosotis TaxID=1630166 RepID=A0A5M9ZKU4_9BIFI|nr:isopeptide-forming domain-containing fimbrial protein [Bifidobacterium myosotis]KAA8828194.1 isopeptide-forming domain-containing fimbrial protein [Bifidobacterium myosotis]